MTDKIPTISELQQKLAELEAAVNTLADKLVKTANRLDEHEKRPVAHNPGTLYKK